MVWLLFKHKSGSVPRTTTERREVALTNSLGSLARAIKSPRVPRCNQMPPLCYGQADAGTTLAYKIELASCMDHIIIANVHFTQHSERSDASTSCCCQCVQHHTIRTCCTAKARAMLLSRIYHAGLCLHRLYGKGRVLVQDLPRHHPALAKAF